MKTIRYVPHEDTSTVQMSIPETDELVVVGPDGLETDDVSVQRALDAHPSVKREALAASAEPATTRKASK